jgi:hypothetical protein
MPTPNIAEILTTTLENRSKKLADNVTKNNALLNRLNKKGKVKTFSGGVEIRQELEYAENSTYKRYSGYEALNIAPSEVFTSAAFGIKQAAVAVSINGLEMLQNSGEEALIDLLESRVANAERTLVNGIAADVYSDGTADGGKQIGGLQLLIADTPTSGTVGGINRATWAFWRNVSYDATTNGGAAVTSANIQKYMNTVYLSVSRGTDRPDLIVADNTYFQAYLESLQAIQRITSSSDVAEAGFDSLKYMGADVVFDGGYGGNAPLNRMYFLNTDFIHFRPHADRNMKAIGGDRMNTNQDAITKIIGWAGNMTLSNAFVQGVLKD